MFRVFVFVLLTALPLIASRPDLSSVPKAPTCGAILADLRPCLSFIKGTSDPSQGCCDGVKDINSLARTRPDKIAICGCIKTILGTIGPYNPSLIPTLPSKCSVSVDLPPIDKSYDCNKVSAFSAIHASDTFDDVYDDEKQDGIILHKEANYIMDYPTLEKEDSIAPKGMISGDYDRVNKEQDSIAPKGMISGDYYEEDGAVFDVPGGF